MDILELIEKRRSLRVYSDKQIPKEVRRAVLEAAVRAPTAGALMLYAIIEIESAELKATLSQTCDNQPFIAKAPWVVLFAADYQRLYDDWLSEGGQLSRKPGAGDLLLACDDALIAAQTAVIAAEAMGLGSCYIGDIMENAERHRELLNLPEYVFPAAMLCFGYPPNGNSQTEKTTPRLPLELILHRDTYTRKQPTEESLAVSRRGRRKFEADFSVEMTRSVRDWLEKWR